MTAILERVLGLEQNWKDKHIFRNHRRGIEVAFGWSGPRLDITNLGNDDNSLTLIVGIVFLTAYFRLRVKHSWEMWENAIGFYFGEDALVLEWPWGGKRGQGHKIFLRYPWSLEFYKRWDVVEDGRLDDFGRWDREAWNWVELPRYLGHLGHWDIANKHVYNYEYRLKSGEVQKRKATVYVNRTEWRRRWIRWAPLFNRVRDSISVDFDSEVGERTGSWKGGVLGCGYEMLPGESPLQTLRRMERERKFT